MYKNKKFIFAIIVIILLSIFSFIIVYSKTQKNIDVNNDIQSEENIEIPKVENIVEDEISNTTENETIEDNNENNDSKEDVKKEITQTEKTTKVEVTEKTTKVEVKEAPQKVQSISSSYDENSFKDGYLKHYPSFGDKYATLIVNKIGINAPIYFGATDEILLKGVAHDSGSYFPGEGGAIIMCEHNYMNNFRRLGELRNGDIIEVKTSYGDFYYKLYKSQTVLETESEKLPIQKDEEILMIYTCYPFNSKGHTEYRYVIYAKKI